MAAPPSGDARDGISGTWRRAILVLLAKRSAAVRDGQAACAFLLNSAPLTTLQAIAAAGGKMPHKSTYFYPKVLSGLITWRLDS